MNLELYREQNFTSPIVLMSGLNVGQVEMLESVINVLNVGQVEMLESVINVWNVGQVEMLESVINEILLFLSNRMSRELKPV